MLTEKISNGQDIFDAVINTYGNLDLTYKLIQENPIIENIDVDLNTLPNLSVVWDEIFDVPPPAQIDSPKEVAPNFISKITAVQGQTLFDIGLMSYGTLDNLMKLLQDSQIDNPNSDNIAGHVFTFDNREIVDYQIFKNYISSGYIINTGESERRTGKSFGLSFDNSFN